MRKSTQQVEENTQEQQKAQIGTQLYRITYGAFDSKLEAIMAAGETRKKGFITSLIIEDGKYKLLYVKDINRARADEAIMRIKNAHLKAEIFES